MCVIYISYQKPEIKKSLNFWFECGLVDFAIFTGTRRLYLNAKRQSKSEGRKITGEAKRKRSKTDFVHFSVRC